MTALTHSYSGPAYPAYASEGGWPGYQHEPESELIGGAFRVVEEEGAWIVVDNGEESEKFWKVDFDRWEEGRDE